MAAQPLICRDISTSPPWLLNKIQRNLTGSKISASSTNLCYSGRLKGRPGLWSAETFPTSTLWPLNRIQRKLTGSKISTSSTKFVLFDRRNLTGSKISMSYTKYAVFLGRWEKQDGCPGLWLTETFSTSPPNGIQQNLTGNKICQRHLPSLCFSGRSEKHFTHVYDMWPLGLLFVY